MNQMLKTRLFLFVHFSNNEAQSALYYKKDTVNAMQMENSTVKVRVQT